MPQSSNGAAYSVGGDSSNIVVLRTPRGAPALPVMRVVISGVASRCDLPFERLDDLQLALETLLAEEPDEGGELVLNVSADADGFWVKIEGLSNQALRSVLVATDPFRPCEGCLLDVRLFLDALVDSYRVVGETGRPFAVELEKRVS